VLERVGNGTCAISANVVVGKIQTGQRRIELERIFF
jgi:hypothetical protein